ncbi:hypothetical protein EMIT0P253_470009 [Pseudomonas sp. IT-P253]
MTTPIVFINGLPTVTCGSLLAKEADNSTLMSTDPTLSRAGSLPQGWSAFYLERALLSLKLTLT